MTRPFPAWAMLALSACVGSPPIPAVDFVAPPFAPIAFFTGHTRGDGVLRTMMSHPRAVHIEGEGRVGGDGVLTLVQRVEQEGKLPRTRRWSLHATGSGSYAGVLSDAVGPIVAKVDGDVLHIRFRAKGGLAIEQWLALQPGSRAVSNRLVVRKFGMRVAVLDETIRKID